MKNQCKVKILFLKETEDPANDNLEEVYDDIQLSDEELEFIDESKINVMR